GAECLRLAYNNRLDTQLPLVPGEVETLTVSAPVHRLVDADTRDVALSVDGAVLSVVSDAFDTATQTPIVELDGLPVVFDYRLRDAGGATHFVVMAAGTQLVIAELDATGLSVTAAAEEVPHEFPLPLQDLSFAVVDETRSVFAVQDATGAIHYGTRICP